MNTIMSETGYALVCDAIKQAQERHKGKAIIHDAYDGYYEKGADLKQVVTFVIYIYVDVQVCELRLKPSQNIAQRVTQAIDKTVNVLLEINEG